MPVQEEKTSAAVREAQARLGKIFSAISTPEELDEITGVVTNYLSARIDRETDAIVASKGLEPDDFRKLAQTHIRRKTK